MTGLLADLRYAARGLRRDPTFTITAVATLALALGANVAIFNLGWATLFRSLPYEEPERIVAIANPPLGFTGDGFRAGVELRESPVLEDVALYYDASGANLETGREPRRVRVAQVSGTFLRTLGSQPLIGRDFTDAESVAGGNRVLLMGESLWRRQYGGDAGILGGTVRLNGLTYTIVGVLPDRFELPAGAEVWVPLPMTWEFVTGSASSPLAIGRLRPGVERAAAERLIETAVTERRPRDPGEEGVRLIPLKDQLTATLRVPLRVLMAAVVIIVLIGCVNLSGLMLARAQSRDHEFGVRAVLGAGGLRIARLQTVEALLIATIGAAAAVLLVVWTTDAIAALFPQRLLPTQRLAPDVAVIGYTAAVALLTGLAFGLPPAVHAARSGRSAGSAREAGESPRRLRIRGALLIAQVALGFVLVAAAGLLGRSIGNLYDVPLGFEPDRVVSLRLALPATSYETAGQRRAFADRLLERVRGLPDVDHAALGDVVPLDGELGVRFRVSRPGATFEAVMAEAGSDRRAGVHHAVSPGWFETMGVRLREGRPFDQADGRGEPVWILSDALAAELFPGAAAIGRRVSVWKGRTAVEGTVIGVVAGIRGAAVQESPAPQLYEPFAQAPSNLIALVVRHRGGAAGMTGAVRAAVHEIDPALPLYDVRSLPDLVSASLGSRRGVTFIMTGFGALALLLAAVGLYGLLAQSVARRRREIGVRMALGARRSGILRMVLERGLRLAAAGTAIGFAGAALSAHALRSLLFGVEPLDPVTFAGVAAIMLGTAAAACAIPAVRAAGVDPSESLRE